MKSAFVLALICAGLLACCSAEITLPSFTVNLDDEPEQRWQGIYETLLRIDQIKGVLYQFIQVGQLSLVAAGCNATCKSRLVAKFQERFPDYYAELQGIAGKCQEHELPIATEDLVMEQIRYEWTVLDIASPQQVTRDPEEAAYLEMLKLPPIGCTSTLVCDEDNNVYHGRGLDWFLPSVFAQTMFHVNFQKNGHTIIQAEQLLGLIGFLTASSIGKFTMSINAKKVTEGDPNNPTLWSFVDCFEAVDMQPIMVGFRYYAENMNSFDDFVDNVTKTATCSPRYSIIGGPEGKGIRIQHNLPATYNEADYSVTLQNETLSCTNESWYVAQCNSDFDVPATFTGDFRRMLVMNEFNTMTRAYATTPIGLFRAMVVPYVRNNRTVHTTVMSPTRGIILTVAYDQDYPELPLPTPPTPTPVPTCDSSKKGSDDSDDSDESEKKNSQSCTCENGISSSSFVIPSFALLALVAFVFAL